MLSIVGVEANTIRRMLFLMLAMGVEAHTISYSNVINAFERACNMADHWLSMMLNAGVEANTISFSIVIHSCLLFRASRQTSSAMAL